jgi:CDP-diacylglycerol--serine O-phosphatidyltransferase
MKKHIANIFTLLNLFFGCIAIVLALQTDNISIYTNDEFLSTFNIPENISLAALFLFMAAVVDFLDGFVARMLKTTSDLGKQLDSLSDVVSFGVAPGAILFQLLRLSYMREENGLDVSFLLLLPAFIFSLAAAFRLAVFNLDASQTKSFKGLPTPAAGLFVASLPLILHNNPVFPEVSNLLINKYFLYSTIIVLSTLMVSRISLMALKFDDYSFNANKWKYILLIVSCILVLFLQWLAVPLILICYIILSLAQQKTSNS